MSFLFFFLWKNQTKKENNNIKKETGKQDLLLQRINALKHLTLNLAYKVGCTLKLVDLRQQILNRKVKKEIKNYQNTQ